MKKRAQVTLFILLAIVLVVSIVLVSWLKDSEEPEIVDIECSVDSDCVPNECCDASACAPIAARPDCSGVVCLPGCKSYDSGKLGCTSNGVEEGICVCANQKCVAQFG